MPEQSRELKNFKIRAWQYAYKTSSPGVDGKAVDILHDFYIPALSLSVRYDRMAGYFRSTSLAAASQGFSAFTSSGGKMRLIVGADLAEEDVVAILKGNQALMTARLEQTLGERESWPEHVARGVELLSWMIAKGHLEVRVAFRIHSETGEPLSFQRTDDGYVHEKWAVFRDGEGNRLYVSGSLNESRTALVLNAENIDVHADWWDTISKQRADDAEQAFQNMWGNLNPHVKVMPLPDALRQKLIKIGEGVTLPLEIDGSTAVKPQVEPPSAMERLQFALVKDGPRLPRGRYVGMETAPVKPWPHQEVVARRLVQTWPYSYLLCDEVGLGKTIEAGLAIRSLYLSGLAKRVLIAPPASLTRQWQRELESKFFLPFARAMSGVPVKHEVIFPVQETFHGDSLYDQDLCIVSTGLLSRKERREALQGAKPFDIVLVDEAHYARRKNPKNGTRAAARFGNLYVTLRDQIKKKTRCLWMATATPLQLDWVEVFDLLQLTGRVGPFQFDPSLTWAYYKALGEIVREQDIRQEEWDLLRRAILSMSRNDPFLWDYLQEAVIHGIVRTAATQWLERGRIPIGADKKYVRRLIFSAAPLSRVMLRHTRPLLEIYQGEGHLRETLPRREVLPVPRIVMTSIEKQAYDELETYCRDLTGKIADFATGNNVMASLGFFLSFLRLRFASSLFAIKETLRRRHERVIATLAYQRETEHEDADSEELEALISEEYDADDRVLESLLRNRNPEDLEWERERLKDMLHSLEDLSATPSKMRELLSVLQKRRLPGDRIKQTVVFTRFYDTLQDIVQRLREIDPSMLIGTYSGKGGQYVDPETKRLRGVERDEIKHRFLREEIDILLCTDAAAEGLNLQTADLLINYDLPWNPMKVEQRIGRIDRIGQKHPQVFVLNLCYVDSAEQIVYDRLLKRLAQAGDIVGMQQISLLPIKMEEFNDLAAGTLSADELESRARERIAIQRRRTESMEMPARDLYDIYVRMGENQDYAASPVTLEAIWSAILNSKYLKDLGCTVSMDSDKSFFTVRGLGTEARGAALTVDRGLYDSGIKGMEGRLHFATYGDPLFDSVLDEFEAFDLPKCICRLQQQVPDLEVEVVAYAAACKNDDGLPEIKLVSSWRDLDDIQLDESAVLSENDLGLVRSQLHDLIRQEFDPTRATNRLEEHNERAGRSQLIMNFLTLKSLLRLQGFADTDNFWILVKERLDVLIETRERLLLADMPVEYLRMIKDDLLFDLRIPQVGEKTTATVPVYAVAAAVDAGCRIADAMKVRKADLTIDKVSSGIERQIEKEIKAYTKRIN